MSSCCDGLNRNRRPRDGDRLSRFLQAGRQSTPTRELAFGVKAAAQSKYRERCVGEHDADAAPRSERFLGLAACAPREWIGGRARRPVCRLRGRYQFPEDPDRTRGSYSVKLAVHSGLRVGDIAQRCGGQLLASTCAGWQMVWVALLSACAAPRTGRRRPRSAPAGSSTRRATFRGQSSLRAARRAVHRRIVTH